MFSAGNIMCLLYNAVINRCL